MKPKKDKTDVGFLHQHERALGRFLTEADGRPYAPLQSLDEARSVPDGVVILVGDYEGQIYVVSRAAQVLCTGDELEQLLEDLDALVWKDPTGRKVHYERLPVGAGVPGGMGGGVVAEEPWIHEEFWKLGLAPAILAVLKAEKKRIRD